MDLREESDVWTPIIAPEAGSPLHSRPAGTKPAPPEAFQRKETGARVPRFQAGLDPPAGRSILQVRALPKPSRYCPRRLVCSSSRLQAGPGLIDAGRRLCTR